jgi:hypothetical protein
MNLTEIRIRKKSFGWLTPKEILQWTGSLNSNLCSQWRR